jgi:pyruvate/2-oxoglutarate dehydrogenase complex dihydrolipoamide acyltransferase (E2) component
MKDFGTYKIKKFSLVRQALSDVYDVSIKKTNVVGLIELDVEKARRIIEKRESETGVKLSFTGWLIKCIAHAVYEHKEVHAYRIKRNKLIVFDNVHVNVMVERTTNSGKKIPINHIIKFANEKSVQDITNEIREVQEKKVDEKNQVVEGTPGFYLKLYPLVPKFIKNIIIRRKLENTKFFIENAGTVTVTSIGMFARNLSGWAVTVTTSTLSVAVGGIKKKPVLVDGKLEEHEFLNLTIQIDHKIVDGGPITRFVSTLSELIESGFGI